MKYISIQRHKKYVTGTIDHEQIFTGTKYIEPRRLRTTDTFIVVSSQALFRFVGVKSRTKEQLQRLMYHEEMEDWMANARIEDMRLKVQ